MIYESENTELLYQALMEFDKKEVSLEPDKAGNRGHKYISKGFILKVTRRLLVECGLRITRTTRTEDNKQYIVHEIKHIKSGQFIRSMHFYNDMLKPLDNAGIQTLGGLRTYISRYEICDMLYIDDLGLDPDELITIEQYEKILKAINNDEKLATKICSNYKIPNLKFLLYSLYDEVMRKIDLTLKDSKGT